MDSNTSNNIFTIPHIQDKVFKDNEFTPKQLATFCLVSRSWAAMLKPFVWHSLTFKNISPKAAIPYQEGIVANAQWIRKLMTRHSNVLEWLDGCPESTRLESLDLQFMNTYDYTSSSVTAAMIQRNPKLEELRWYFRIWGDQPNPLPFAIVSPSIMSSEWLHLIKLDFLHIELELLGRVLEACKKLDTLLLEYCHCFGAMPSELSKLSALKKIGWECVEGEALGGLNGILKAAEGIKELVLDMTSDDVAQLDPLDSLRGLESLKVKETYLSHPVTSRLLAATPTLARLKLTHRDEYEDVQDLFLVKTICESGLTETLVEIGIHETSVSSTDMEQILRSCKNLRVLSAPAFDRGVPQIRIRDMGLHPSVEVPDALPSTGWACLGLEELVLRFHDGAEPFSYDQRKRASDSATVDGVMIMVDEMRIVFEQLSRLTKLKKVEIAIDHSIESQPNNEEIVHWNNLVDHWKLLESCLDLVSLNVHWCATPAVEDRVKEWSMAKWPNLDLTIDI